MTAAPDLCVALGPIPAFDTVHLVIYDRPITKKPQNQAAKQALWLGATLAGLPPLGGGNTQPI
jgi:hypothetical protein